MNCALASVLSTDRAGSRREVDRLRRWARELGWVVIDLNRIANAGERRAVERIANRQHQTSNGEIR